MPCTLRIWAVVLSGAILGCIFGAAALLANGRYEGLALYAAFDAFCHQQAERSWSLLSQPLPVCVRCLGFYSGAFVWAVAGAPFSRPWFLAACGFLLATWAGEIAQLVDVPSGVRWASGFLFGFTLASALNTTKRSLSTPPAPAAPGGFALRAGRPS